MNRFVGVPSSLMNSGTIPVDAMKIANIFSLEIRSMDDCSEIKIFSEPSIKALDYDKDYTNNRTWSLDLTNEFIEMREACYVVIDNIVYPPAIKEKHRLKFRIRMCGIGKKTVHVFVNNTEVETIEVMEKQ